MIGIDPGQTGALALLIDGTLARVIDMPMNIYGRVDGSEVNEFIDSHNHSIFPVEVWIEEVHSMPKQGVASTFKFGMSYGIVIGAVECTRATINYARPRAWKKHFGLSSNKNESLELARELFPDQLDLFQRKKDNGRAEAALIALYGLEHPS